MRRYLAVAAILLLASPAVAADDLPNRKAGLWEIKMGFGTPGASPQTMQQCTDAASDKDLRSSAGGIAQEVCSKREVKTEGATMTVDSVCTRNGKSITTHSVITGSFDSAYTMKVTTDSAGPRGPGELGQISMTMEAKWLGPCKSDQKPGDMIMPGGMKFNVNDMRKMMQPGVMPQPPTTQPPVKK